MQIIPVFFNTTLGEFDVYTLSRFGPPLRIADVKNVGKDLAPEELRIYP